MRPSKPLWLVLVALSGAGSGCSNIPLEAADAAPEEPASPLLPTQPPVVLTPEATCVQAPAPSGMRPLSKDEYATAVRDLLGEVAEAAEPLLPNDPDGFAASAVQSPLPTDIVLSNALKLSNHWVSSPAFASTLPCATAGDASRCAATFISEYGRKALRRPLTNEERLLWLALFEREAAQAGFVGGIEAVLRSMLVHPDFLLHLERGKPTAVAEERRLSRHELANRLSFALRGGPPDAALAKAADEGRLGTPAEIDVQVQRLLAEPRGRENVLKFYRRWLRLDRDVNGTKDPDRFPLWTPSLAEQAREESLHFAAWNFFEEQGNLRRLLLDTRAKLSPQLAQLYGVPWREGWMDLPRSERAGILTRAAFLAATSGPKYASASFRGALLLNDFLCWEVPLRPPNAQFAPPPEPMDGLTRRQRLERVTQPNTCRGCHDLLDPLGFAFGHYDAVGRSQTFEDGLPIDTTGEIHVNVNDDTELEGSWQGALGLAEMLAAEPRAKACMSRKLWQHLIARPIDDVQDACMLDRLEKAAQALDGNLRPLMVQVLTDPLFGKFTSPPFPQAQTGSSEAFTPPEAARDQDRAAVQAAWQFRRTAEEFPLATRSALNEWSRDFDNLSRRLAFTGLDGP